MTNRPFNPSLLLLMVMTDEAPCRATVYKWIQEFQSGRVDVTDRKSTGRPTEIGDDHREKLQRIVLEDRRISKTELAKN